MINRFGLLILFIILVGDISSQQVYFNNRCQFNEMGLWNTASSVIENEDGYLITGATIDTLNIGWRWIHLSNITPSGNLEFTKYIGNNSNYFYPARPGSFIKYNNSIYLTGNIALFDPYRTAGMIFKLTESLDTVWSRKYFGDKISPIDSNQHFTNLTICNDGGFAFTGEMYNTRGISKILLLKTDSLGNQEWVKYFGNSGLSGGYSIIQTTDNGYAIGGFWYVPGSPVYTGDPIVIKTDSLGNQEWSKNIGGFYLDNRARLCLSDDGHIVAATDYADSLLGSDQPYSRTFIVKIDNEGDILWSHKYGQSKVYNFVKNIRCLQDGSFILCGSVPAEYPHVKSWLLKVDADGDSLWYRLHENLMGWQSENYLHDVIPTYDNGFLSCGYVFPLPPDTGVQDSWVIKFDSLGCDTPGCTIGITIKNPTHMDNRVISIFPNPVRTDLYIKFPSSQHSSLLYIYDLLGKEKKQVRVAPKQDQYTVSVKELNQGVYIVILVRDNIILGKSKFVVKR